MPPESCHPSVGLVHEALLFMRGGERVFSQIAACFPTAPIYTLVLDRREVGCRFEGRDIRPSPLQRLPVNQTNYRWLVPLYPWAAGRLNVTDHDVVVSSHYAFAHGIRASPGATHICYCHIPFRYAWCPDDAREFTPRLLWPLGRRMLARIRDWDMDASTRVTKYIANSRLTQERIHSWYGRSATIVHPPVELERFSVGTPEDYYLVVGELVPHKRVELALEAARRSGSRVVVVGGGPLQRTLQERYGDVATFLGRVGDAELARLYRRARALVMPQVEDFGIVSVEAQASGRPVLAASVGGALETVRDGVTGVLVASDSVDELAEAMRFVDWTEFDPADAVANAGRFSPATFRARLLAEVGAAAAPVTTALRGSTATTATGAAA
jgi:glycosyltransferase involved in cell wall biosynthesis